MGFPRARPSGKQPGPMLSRHETRSSVDEPLDWEIFGLRLGRTKFLLNHETQGRTLGAVALLQSNLPTRDSFSV